MCEPPCGSHKIRECKFFWRLCPTQLDTLFCREGGLPVPPHSLPVHVWCFKIGPGDYFLAWWRYLRYILIPAQVVWQQEQRVGSALWVGLQLVQGRRQGGEIVDFIKDWFSPSVWSESDALHFDRLLVGLPYLSKCPHREKLASWTLG